MVAALEQALAGPGMADAAAIYDAARGLYAPHVRVPVVEWIEREFVISRDSGAAFPGPYRFAPVPWWREVAEAFADDETPEVVVAKSSQVGYTELVIAFLAWCMAQDPSSMLLIQPTIGMAEAFSKERLGPVLQEVPALRDVLRGATRGMARSSDDTLLRKAFAGGWLALIGANSPSSLASRPVRRVAADELDRWPVSAGAEGSPLSLAAKRQITYWNRKRIAGGTPVDAGASATWDLWERSDQRHWTVACPHCATAQRLRWRGAGDDADDAGEYRIRADRDAAGQFVLDSAYYVCEQGCVIEERHKAAMVAAGRWVPTHPGRPTRGYHIWSAYSPFIRWGELLREFDAARGAEAELKVFVNTLLGRPFAPAAEKLDPARLAARAEPLGTPPVPPPEVGLLTAGVDVQADRLEYVVTGWGDREAGTVLEYAQVEGDPGDDATWDALAEALAASRGNMRVAAVAVDSGYRPETVWRFAERRRHPYRLFATKGMDGRGRLLVAAPGAVTHKRQRRPWLVGTDTAKDSLAARLRSAPNGPQGVRFADTIAPEYFEHLTAEELRTVYVANRPVRRWVLRAGRRNEGLDCTLLALAALHALGPKAVASLGDLAARRAAAPPAVPPPPAPDPFAPLTAAAGRMRPPRRGFVQGWR